jgi:hypothetical protein
MLEQMHATLATMTTPVLADYYGRVAARVNAQVIPLSFRRHCLGSRKIVAAPGLAAASRARDGRLHMFVLT